MNNVSILWKIFGLEKERNFMPKDNNLLASERMVEGRVGLAPPKSKTVCSAHFITSKVKESEQAMKDGEIIDGNCWVACCDLLGFKKRIYEFEKSGVGYLRAFHNNDFKTVTQAFERAGNCNPDRVFSAWFSDTFLFFSGGDSKDDFELVNRAFREFCREMISEGWPLRGAIGFGQLYADRTRNLFLGSGIINAHHYVEKKKQDWIGIVVTPEANKRLSELTIDLGQRRLEFTKYPVPFRQGKGPNNTFELLFAYRIHRDCPDVIKAVKSMRDKYSGTKYERKYENTLRFFEQYPEKYVANQQAEDV